MIEKKDRDRNRELMIEKKDRDRNRELIIEKKGQVQKQGMNDSKERTGTETGNE